MSTVEQAIEAPGAFYPGLTHSLYGESESGKSLIAQWAVIEQLAQDDGRRVLYVDFESNADQIVPRLVALAAGYGMSLPQLREAIGRLDYVSPQGRITQTFIDNYLTPGRYGMAIVDGVTASIAMWGAKSNSGDEFTSWHHDLPERIARMTGAAVIVIDHVGKGTERGRFAIGSQAKMAVLTGAAYLVDVERPFAPGRPGSAVMRVAKDRPGDVRAHAGKVAANRLQPWARVTIDGAADHSKITLTIDAIDDDENLDELPGEFSPDLIAWTDVAVPDEIGDMLKGKGKAHATDILRVMFHAGTVDGLTQADIRAQWHERRPDVRGHRSRFAEAWACLDRSLAVAHGGAGSSRWVLSSNFEAVLKAANARP